MTLTLARDVVPTETEHGTVLLDERRGRYFKLNHTGAFVLRALLDGADREQAADLLHQEYGIDAERARTDVSALVDALCAAKLARP
ncbi:lasso peptide biosynthesis PqqD family chaperone [Streptomyces palmae]|uniref:Lasso peptide biosynthesis PqqD family chaperone n=1 Tax=Streptomyces palmae TaxID=1701085 RepID=A0A4Z0GMJ4_9ACTN|nr:lasso peptide biosynthesis PqqD family chaperone [Streptomyces palmae]TGA98051.1 lasso peptide biosynthesis PqqD family chaperone [Streptomyces palmae]